MTTFWTSYCGDCEQYSGWCLEDEAALRFLRHHWQRTAHLHGLLGSVTRIEEGWEAAQAWTVSQDTDRRQAL
jgi:hypothetical protein